MVNPFDIPGLRPARRLLAVFAASALILGGAGAAGAQETIPPEETTTTTTTTQTVTPEPEPIPETTEPATTRPAPEPRPSTTEPAPDTSAPEQEIPAEDPAEEDAPEAAENPEAVAGEEIPEEDIREEDIVRPEDIVPINEVQAEEGLQPKNRPTRTRRARAGYAAPGWLNPKPAVNPQQPPRCGLRIALVFDLSGSIGPTGVNESKRAATAVIDGLAGTQTEIGLFNFALHAPAIPAADSGGPVSVADQAGVNTLKSKVAALAPAGVNQDATNWDGGLRQIPAGVYDVVYFITDGIPTTNDRQTAYDYGTVPHAADLGDAVGQANRLKAGGSRIVPLLVGDGSRSFYLYKDDVLNADAVKNDPNLRFERDQYYFGLGKPGGIGNDAAGFFVGYGNLTHSFVVKVNWAGRIIDQPDIWSVNPESPRSGMDMTRDISSPEAPISVGSYQRLADTLREQAVAPCRGLLTITKRIVDASGKELSRGEGWEFTATSPKAVLSDESVQPPASRKKLVRKTDGEGNASFRVVSDVAEEITVTETPRDGFGIAPREGRNATCTALREGKKVPVPVTDAGEDGFKVTLARGDRSLESVDCIVDNREDIAAQAAKEPVAGEPVPVAPDGTAVLEYRIVVRNPSATGDAVAENLREVVRLPEGVVADGDAEVAFPATEGVTVTGPAKAIAGADLTYGARIPIAERITLAGGKSQTVTVRIPVRVADPAGADWDRLGRCTGDGSTVSPDGVPNTVALAGDLDASDDNACIPLSPPEPAAVAISKVDADDVATPLEGSRFALYGSTPEGAIDWDRRIDSGAGNASLATGVAAGRYHLVETRAPEGYSLLAAPVPVEITGHAGGYTIDLVNEADAALVEVGPTDPGAASGELWVRVADVATGSLPKTGGAGVAPHALAALIALAAAVAMARRGRGA